MVEVVRACAVVVCEGGGRSGVRACMVAVCEVAN